MHTQKSTAYAVLFILSEYVGTAVRGPCFKGLLKKSLKILKTFTPNTSIYFGEAFEVPRNFSRKVSCVGVWGKQPQLIMLGDIITSELTKIKFLFRSLTPLPFFFEKRILVEIRRENVLASKHFRLYYSKHKKFMFE